jgi:hypothetical protein
VHERAEGQHLGGLFAHGDLAPPDRHGVDAPRRTLVREAGAAEEFVAGRKAAQRSARRERRAEVAQLTVTLQHDRGDAAQRGHDVGLGLIRLVQHVGLVDRRVPVLQYVGDESTPTGDAPH